MKFANTFLILAAFGLAFIGCSNSRQHKDPSWTAKPANMQVVFTAPAPIVLDFATESGKLAEWFSSNIDNTLKFNSNVPYKVSKISKDLLSYSEKDADGEKVRVPVLKTMSDSVDIYMVLDSIQLTSDIGVRAGAGTTMMSTVGPMIKNNCAHVSASYAFYEVKTGKPLDYGYLDESQCSDQKVIEHDWQNVLRKLILHIINKTPIAQF